MKTFYDELIFFYIEMEQKYKVQILERLKKGFYISKAGEWLQD